ncbi:hypothetical protein GCM10017044_02740 [Kordiimonas sediminis]|uniref:Uncharacterized protein n=1 Tax=Kordiimonas sediminis TaxID=1735581 RepID=A0A919AK28_9PROT|nr:hypothetical protein [Kordiimonas sediminis]GHF12262.1 hypothetical protein GCM10017044_02740 [Kordiimonas sediminis]
MPSMCLIDKDGIPQVRRGPSASSDIVREYRVNSVDELRHCEQIASELFDRFQHMKPRDFAQALDVLITV